jgi:hypothetical protein
LTPDGSLVVSSAILASSYVSLQKEDSSAVSLMQGGIRLSSSILSQHDLAHYGIAPFRMLCGGTTLSFQYVIPNTESFFCDTMNEHGMPYYVHHALQFAARVDQQHWTVQCVILLCFFGWAVVWSAMEWCFNAALSGLPWLMFTRLVVLFVTALVIMLLKRTPFGVRIVWPAKKQI